MNESLKLNIEALAAPLAEPLGLSIWGLEIVGAGRPVVRIYVEGENGCDIDDCAELSRLLGLSLDVEDIMPGAYSLEISSPGLERSFFRPEQLEKYMGETIRLTLTSPKPAWPGRKKFQGRLLSVNGSEISLALEDAPLEGSSEDARLTATWADIQQARLVHDFEANKGVKKGAKA